MFKTVYHRCAGIDVHKSKIVVTIACTDEEENTKYLCKTFKTYTNDLLYCKQWLLSFRIYDVCMESTGKYWIPVFNILEDKINCIIAHPKYFKGYSKKKSDKIDSKLIADLFKYGLVEPSFIPPSDIRQLRDLMRYRNKLINMRTSEKNRFHNSLVVSNIQLSNVFSDVFGKTSQSILKQVLESSALTENDLELLLRKNVKSSNEEILESVNGNFDESQGSKIQVCLSHYDSINNSIELLEEQIVKLSIKYTEQVKLLLTVPGVKEISALFIIAELGTNMNVFMDSKHLVSWAGLSPRCSRSGNKTKSVRINNTSSYIKPLLVQCAMGAIKDNSCPYIRRRYESLRARRGHAKAIVAIARMLLTCIYHILKDNKPFDYERYEALNKKKITAYQRSTYDMIRHLNELGYNVSL